MGIASAGKFYSPRLKRRQKCRLSCLRPLEDSVNFLIMTTTIPLFSDENTQKALASFLKRINSLSVGSDFESERNGHIALIVENMSTAGEHWDNACQINIKWIGRQFVSELKESPSKMSRERLDDIFSMCFRFLFELYLSIPQELSYEFERARQFGIGRMEEFEGNARAQIEYAIKQLPIAIFKQIATSDEIISIKDLGETSRAAKDVVEKFQADLDEREKRVENFRAKLSEYEVAFNFVGLAQGFEKLALSKRSEISSIKLWMVILGIGLLIPLLVEIILIDTHLLVGDLLLPRFLMIALPSLSVVIIMIYYFRVLLHNYRSAKSQLLQIDLRRTLCEFIQSYAEYSAEIKTKDKEALSKFESVIFSGIVSVDEQLPSTYDGLDQLGKLIGSLKK